MREEGATHGLRLIHTGDGARGRAAMALIKVSALKTLVQSSWHSQGEADILEQAVTSRGWPDGGGIHGDSIQGSSGGGVC